MRNTTLFVGLICGALLLCGCAGPSAVDAHWGEAQRGAKEAMVEAAKDQPGRGIDGAGASAAHDGYVESLRTQPERDTKILLDIVEGD